MQSSSKDPLNGGPWPVMLLNRMANLSMLPSPNYYKITRNKTIYTEIYHFHRVVVLVSPMIYIAIC